MEFYEAKKYENLIKVTLSINHKITDLSYMFYECSSLKSISDLDNLNINNVTNLSYMFYGCSSLSSISGISEWKTNNVVDMSHMFHGCSSLKSLQLISKWETNNVEDMSYMFYGCSSLNYIDDIFEWNINKVKDINLILYDCDKLGDREFILNEFLKKNNRLKLEEEEERRKKEEEIKRREKEQRKRQKEEIIRKQMEFKKKKTSEENIKIILEDMCILGNIMKKEIIEEKKNEPKKFISIQEAIKNKNTNEDIFCLGIFANVLENIGVTTAIERNKSKNEDTSNTILQFLMNGMIEKKKYSFDLGEKRNNELLYNLDDQKKFNNKLKKKLSKECNIPENEIIITNPLKGSYNVQVIFEREDFNNKNFDINKFKNNCTEKEFSELKNLKEIHSSLIMEGCKLSLDMLDSSGNRESGFEVGGKRGGLDYFPPLKGWKGFGLKAWDKYDNGNNDWLGCDGNPNEWAVAYHGIGTKRGVKVEGAAHNIFIGEKFKYKADRGQACKDHKNINKKYKFNPKEDKEDHTKEVGIGAYCSPNPDVMEEYANYAKPKARVNGQEYLLGFMMRVKPDKIRISEEEEDYWVLDGTTKEMRPYRLLVKEC